MGRRTYVEPPPKEETPPALCLLCGRELAGIVNKHHLLPVSKGGAGTPTILLHKICHDKIHTTLTEQQLRSHYGTVEALRGHPDIENFINWVRKRPPEFYEKTRKGS